MVRIGIFGDLHGRNSDKLHEPLKYYGDIACNPVRQ